MVKAGGNLQKKKRKARQLEDVKETRYNYPNWTKARSQRLIPSSSRAAHRNY